MTATWKKPTYTDWRVCSWPSHLLALGKDHRLLYVDSNRCGNSQKCIWLQVQSCFVRVITLLLSVVMYVVRAACTFTLGLLKTKTPNKWRPVAWRSYSNRESCLWKDLYVPSPGMSLQLFWASTQTMQFNGILLSKRQCIHYSGTQHIF